MYYQLIIKNYIKEHPTVDMKIILSTSNPRNVDINIENQVDEVKLFLLDIEFSNSKIKGIELATDIRNMDSRAKIIFITTHEELTPLIFERKVQPLDCIDKEIGMEKIKERLYDDLDEALKSINPNLYEKKNTFEFNIGPKKYSFTLDQVDYFESVENNHNIFLHSTFEVIEFPGTLKSIEQKFPEFYRAHKSLVVNIDNIKEIDIRNHKLNFKDKSTCDISRRKLVALKKLYELN
nr:LytTR family DNA-binding domain-containing protein [Companilactobacillus heilongjiangensis]